MVELMLKDASEITARLETMRSPIDILIVHNHLERDITTERKRNPK